MIKSIQLFESSFNISINYSEQMYVSAFILGFFSQIFKTIPEDVASVSDLISIPPLMKI